MGLRRPSVTTTGLSQRSPCAMGQPGLQSGVALRLPPRSMTRPQPAGPSAAGTAGFRGGFQGPTPDPQPRSRRGANDRGVRHARIVILPLSCAPTRAASGADVGYSPPCFRRTSARRTDLPPCRLLSSAASMNVNSSRVSAGETGAMPVWKNFITSRIIGA